MEERVRWRGAAVRWVSDEPQPGWVEVRCIDALGQTWTFFDKPPIFGNSDQLVPNGTYPVETSVDCRVLLSPKRGDGTIRVATIWGDADDGTSEFDVLPEALSK